MKKALILGSFMFLSPAMAFAQTSSLNNIEGTLRNFLNLINNTLLPIVIALALLYFFWGLAKFILNSGDEDAQTKGKNIMLWGIIAFFVMVSVWGIVNFFGDAFDLDTRTPNLPQAPR
ncbi:MAG: pilin [Patescibacteria group bacterium]